MRLVLVTAVLVACSPPCKRVCRKVLFECELDSERVALDECIESCQRQEALYDGWDDEGKQELFDDHKRCIRQSSCDEIAEGACYEGYEELFVFDPDKVLPPVSTPGAVDSGTL